ncbi:flagellar motor protein PomA [sulfur-oxidizing endosymbiont of Gigantopelta aegis]|uniref:flagellar motor protein PomA n=1 Tax=sulfur-oxidizing endosymbiont of Gigantopelta aegis TaxID=2794934 RepID=UPI0018DE0385|nr:flagellar motor protein PomA [sulfur-oxidizing endosymbiont of Gigantopelta aegis]
MDIATVIGIIGALAIIAVAMVLSGGIVLFINVPSMLVVFGGASFAVIAMFPLGVTLGSIKVVLKAILNKSIDPNELIEKGVELATIARKEGILGLEGQDIPNEFLQKGISLCVDGHEPDFVQRMLSKDINLAVERHELGQKFLMKLADMGPAMGMIGTLIGLVGMLANMDDPKTIGPSMAVALLTTLYGAVLANALCIPLADKLTYLADQQRLSRTLILEVIGAIQEGINPKVMGEMLQTYLPEGKRAVAAEE